MIKYHPVEGLTGPLDITDEIYREYDFGSRTYRIDKPVALYYSSINPSTHRIVDSEGIVHCVPFDKKGSTVLRWKTADVNKPIIF